MPLIRPDQKILRAGDYQLWLEAQAVLEHARLEAERIIASAVAAREEEKERGYREGQAEARMEAAERMLENIGSTIDYYEQVESEVAEIVLACVQKIVAGFDDQERVVSTVKGALAVVRNQKQVTLRVAPTSVNVVKVHMTELLADFPGVGFIDVLADARLNDDACILETEIGIVEASIAGQIAALRSAITRVFGSRKG